MPRDSHDDELSDSARQADHEELVSTGNGRLPAVPEEPAREPEREEATVESEHEVRVRRTPRFGRFMVLGGAVFGVAAFIATYSFPQGSGYDRNTVFGFVLLAAVAVGVGLGALAAIIASAATKRTERTVVADRIDIRQPDAAASGDEALPNLGELPAEAEQDEPLQHDTARNGAQRNDGAARNDGFPRADGTQGS
ncbi:hypothetical protein ACO2Q7_09220 [Rathayibacter sp. KR2-224]|uniref:hypothetical protein n=1 Tax=Rathayibacter sp. KR2-224 TaxID=3400913 RepID=UPI003C067045